MGNLRTIGPGGAWALVTALALGGAGLAGCDVKDDKVDGGAGAGGQAAAGGSTGDLDAGTGGGPTGGTAAGGTDGTGGTGGTAGGGLDVENDPVLGPAMNDLVQACQAACAAFGACMVDMIEGQDQMTCEAECVPDDQDVGAYNDAASSEALLAYLNAQAALEECTSALSCEDAATYAKFLNGEDGATNPCQAQADAIDAAQMAAYPGEDH